MANETIIFKDHISLIEIYDVKKSKYYVWEDGKEKKYFWQKDKKEGFRSIHSYFDGDGVIEEDTILSNEEYFIKNKVVYVKAKLLFIMNSSEKLSLYFNDLNDAYNYLKSNDLLNKEHIKIKK